ncbi:ras-related protein Rab-28-like [Battus philenor]|uniref:ras-related protein Rab-28-like n=1 Tax=Battus philenor TaxID=42288 RepID=UPI0035CEA9E1
MSDTEDEESGNREVKITILGEPFTGKTSLCHKYFGTNGVVQGGSTWGAEVMAGQCLGLRPPVTLYLCDVAGNSLSTCMLRNYLYTSDIVIFVYDLTNLQSFEKLNEWIRAVDKIVEREPKKPLLALFGNKSDLEHQRAVRLSCVKNFASEHLLENFKGSARTGEMVNYLFSNLIGRLLNYESQQITPPAAAYPKPIINEIEEQSNGPTQNVDAVPTSPLIMNRKTLRKIQRKASSSVCCVQ